MHVCPGDAAVTRALMRIKMSRAEIVARQIYPRSILLGRSVPLEKQRKDKRDGSSVLAKMAKKDPLVSYYT